jgi:surfactin synthase thioesterase subunit
MWEPYLERLQQNTAAVSVWVPILPQQGNCCEDLAVREIIAAVREFIRHHPGEPIILVGSSLGARLAARIELALRKHASTLALFSVAGVHYGSTRIVFRKLHTDRKLYENLHFASLASQVLISEQRQQLPAQVERSYTFYVSRHDSQVVPARSGLPLLGHRERFFVVEGVDHWGMVPELASTIVAAAEAWRKNQPHRIAKG